MKVCVHNIYWSNKD